MTKYINNLETKKVLTLKDLASAKENNLNVFSLVERNSLMIICYCSLRDLHIFRQRYRLPTRV